MKKLLILGVLLTNILGVAVVAQPVFAQNQSKDAVCEGIAITGGSCDQQPGQPTINGTVALVINILSFIVGVAAVIVIIIAGLRYITSGGDSNSVSGAKNAIIYAVVGLVIVGLAQVIVQFVLNRVDQSTKQSNSSIYRLAIADTKQSMVD